MILAFRRRATMQSSCAFFPISISISISISSSKAMQESRTTELLLLWQQPPGRVSKRLQVASAPGGKCNKIKTANSTISQGKRCFHIKRQPYNNILRESLSEFLSVFLSPPIYAQGSWNTANVPNCPIWVTRTTKSLTLDAKQPTLTALWQKGSSGYGILSVNSQLQGKKRERVRDKRSCFTCKTKPSPGCPTSIRRHIFWQALANTGWSCCLRAPLRTIQGSRVNWGKCDLAL